MKRISSLIILLSQTIILVFAQKTAPENWFNLDLEKDKVPGVSTERAYSELLKNKNPTTTIVAVIDGGTEVDHEDLMPIIWVNSKEIDGNNMDDDNNGYIDDIHGWNFIGGKTGDVNEDNLELTRIYKQLTDKYNNGAEKNGADYEAYLKVKTDYEKRKNTAEKTMEYFKNLKQSIAEITQKIGKENPTEKDLKSFNPINTNQTIALKVLTSSSKKKMTTTQLLEQLKRGEDYYNSQLTVHLNQDLNTRKIVGDDYLNIKEKYYGNNNYEGPSGDHGTHVAGIIGAVRDNNMGMNGVANAVRILIVRVVPDGDERDKDIANGIRYAVDNGAKVINMSFGKSYSPGKTMVDDAVRYAVSRDVLLVHAAGNDGKNTDTSNNFPRDTYSNNTGTASSWIEVGASSWKRGKYIPAEFSNYGNQNVDVFAPGVDIYSTIPDSKYASFDGTSMAAPVTAGVAAMLRSYYPSLTAVEIKNILMQSSVKVKGKVILPGTTKRKVKMTDLCQTGGLINAYEAVKMAELMVSKK